MIGQYGPAKMRLVAILFLFPLSLGICGGQVVSASHATPENFGLVTFPTTCNPRVQTEFERGVALLHSFAYFPAAAAFKSVAYKDPACAIAQWGIAMSYFHALWDPPFVASSAQEGLDAIRRAQQIGAGSDRERRFISALALIYDPDSASSPYATRIFRYEAAMAQLAAAYPHDTESQAFYALALLADASPFDKTHANQKRAIRILEPLFQKYPRHPGLGHYLIHACDNQEMARQGLPAARLYSRIAPSAPHALHMPSHIFTRLGMWPDSISSNLAARAAAHEQGDIGEELHAMDYLVYAYLQEGQDEQARDIVRHVQAMSDVDQRDFKIADASMAMPVRYAMERSQWHDAAAIAPPRGAPPHVKAIAVWARAIGLARSGHPSEARAEIGMLQNIERQLQASQQEYADYWAKQAEIQVIEVAAWSAQAEKKPDEARALLRRAADEEDAIEKLPVTPGPIIPAREQLGDLLLQQNAPGLAAKEFHIALLNAPQRHGAIAGLRRCRAQLDSHSPRS